VGIVLALVVPGSTALAWCLDLADGLAAEAAAAGAAVLGGDVADGSALVLTGTSFGVLVGRRPAVRRDGARAGDVVALGPAGAPLGCSAAGLAVLAADLEVPPAGGPVQRVLAVHRAPTVDHTAGARARDAGATALIDLSDGLVRDATRVARASGVVLALELGRLAPADDLVAVARLVGGDPQEWVLTSGEEHAMLAVLPQGGPLPDGFVPVGRVGPAQDGWSGVTVDGVRRTDAGGWVHYPR
jgi:thiamine-monophosphate kinase